MQTQRKNFGGPDCFRLAAALLVVAIHTSPLASFNGDADFFFTRVLARVAVPFFFMVTGQFVLSGLFSEDSREYDKYVGKAKKYLLRLSLLYTASIVLYLPLGLYAGHYKGLTLLSLLRMLVFDGTFYHLWYFPACILGILLLLLMSRFLKLRAAAAVSALLYLIGLFGDSYYGFADMSSVLRTVYEGMFCLFSYTRNGLFLAPIFLILGILAGRCSNVPADSAFSPESRDSSPEPRDFSPKLRDTDIIPERDSDFLNGSLRGTWGCGNSQLLPVVFLTLSFCAMTAEAFLLHFFELQRHDSMYLFLIPVSFFLYRCLLGLPASPRKPLRTASTWIYILHPAFIVVVRGVAKLLRLTDLFVDNSLVHYLAVSILSVAAGLFLTWLGGVVRVRTARRRTVPAAACLRRTSGGEGGSTAGEADPTVVRKLDGACRPGTERAWIELDSCALEHNVRYLQSLLPEGCRLMPAVKANAYGHGARQIAGELNRLGVHDFCVACIFEGIELREAGVRGQILILGYTHPSLFPLLVRYRLTQTVLDFDYAKLLQAFGKKLHVHVAVDTGMHRLGIRCESWEDILAVYRMENLVVDGIFTHLAACDSSQPPCRAFTESQIDAFYQVIGFLEDAGCSCRGLHLLSSYGMINYPDDAGDYVRPGIALYGLLSSEEDSLRIPNVGSDDGIPPLRPVLSLYARVASVRTLQPGESAGYGMAFTADRDMKVAVLSIGYGDGLPRSLSCGNGRVLIDGCSAPVLGRVCMDQTLVDVSLIPGVTQGDVAVLIGRSGTDEITAGELAFRCDTITNEILSRLGSRLERIISCVTPQ